MIETAERLPDRPTATLEPTDEADRFPWTAIAGLVVSLSILIAAMIALCFVVAKLVTGYAV
jgi:flagellar biogenesis protein FliO